MLKVKEWEKLYNANNNHKKPGVPILIRDKRDFNKRTIVGEIEGLPKIINGNTPRRYNNYTCTCT